MTPPADAPLRDALLRLAQGRPITEDEAYAAVGVVVDGHASDAMLAAFLTALRTTGETAEVLAGAVRAVKERAAAWDDGAASIRRPFLDTCGTGGDGANTVNISTAAAIVAASCGVSVAKHGNRSASGNSGSAEVLTALGVAVEADAESLRASMLAVGLTFLYAPAFHPALRHAAAVRRQLPFRTLFNLIGPLANPARPEYQLVGVSGERQAKLVAEALMRLGTTRAAVVRGEDGLDEVTLGGATHVLWVEGGAIRSMTWTRDDFGLPEVDARSLTVAGPAQSAAKIQAFLEREPGAVRSAVLANAAAALLVAGRAGSPASGVEIAAEAVDSGRALATLETWRSFA